MGAGVTEQELEEFRQYCRRVGTQLAEACNRLVESMKAFAAAFVGSTEEGDDVGIEDAKADRGHEQAGDKQHAKVKVEIDTSDNQGDDPTPPDKITGR